VARHRRGVASADQDDPTIDLHGLRVAEALKRVDRFLRAQQASGTFSVRIITGHGTGAVKAAVRAELSNHPSVASYRPGLTQDAVTIVTLRPPQRPAPRQRWSG
jgi:DNA mismatch repair protein MutS2